MESEGAIGDREAVETFEDRVQFVVDFDSWLMVGLDSQLVVYDYHNRQTCRQVCIIQLPHNVVIKVICNSLYDIHRLNTRAKTYYL